jgi:recombination protein RecT
MSNEITRFDKKTLEVVEQQISEYQKNGQIHFPANYSPQNALKSAFLVLQETLDRDKKPVLQTCTKESIAYSLLNTVIQGLSPAKKQIYFIPYGNKLSAMRSYHGTKAVVKRLTNVIDINAEVIYSSDIFEMQIVSARKVIIKHEQNFQNIDSSKIVGAYCIIEYKDKNNEKQEYIEIMNKQQIDKAWSKSKTGASVAKEFPEDMCKRTVINRASKHFVNTSDDSDLLIDAFHKSSGADFEDTAQNEVINNANKEVFDGDFEEVDEIKPEPQAETPAKKEPKKTVKKEAETPAEKAGELFNEQKPSFAD